MYIKYLFVGKIKDLQKYINEELQKENKNKKEVKKIVERKFLED